MSSFTIPLRPLARVVRQGSLEPRISAKSTATNLQRICVRQASILASLRDNAGAQHKKIRRGRGPASGKGKTSGRGHKGQKQHGKVPAGFTGGQTPLEKVKGKRGFVNVFTPTLALINLNRIQSWIEQGRIDASKPITVKELQKSRCLHGVKDGVKLLARDADELKHPIHITVSRASGAAIAAVERLGGTVQTRYYTKASIKRVIQGQSHPTLSLMSAPSATAPQSTSDSTNLPSSAAETSQAESAVQKAALAQAGIGGPTESILETYPAPEEYQYRLPDAYSRKDLEYYRDPAHRGYLSYQLEPGAGPSLFFKTPVQLLGAAENAKQKTKRTKVGAAAAGVNRMF